MNTTTTTMKAVRIHQHGDPDVLTFEAAPRPTPAAGEVLIQVAAAGVNFADLLIRQGVYPAGSGFPLTIGFDVAGTVVEHGEGVTSPAVGTRVMTGLRGGGYAEYVVAPAMSVFPIPDTLDFASATALFVQGLTAYGLLRDATRLQPGETVLIHSAAGGVGSLTVQVAKLMGAGTVIGTASSPEKLALVRELGADAAVDYTAPNWVEQVNAAAGERGVDLILDAVGGEIGAQGLNLLGQRGRIVVYGGSSGQPTMIPAQQLSFKGQSVIGYSMGALMPPETMAAAAGELLDYVTSGQLRVTVGATYPLAEAAAAHRAMAERRTIGKIVLLPNGA